MNTIYPSMLPVRSNNSFPNNAVKTRMVSNSGSLPLHFGANLSKEEVQNVKNVFAPKRHIYDYLDAILLGNKDKSTILNKMLKEKPEIQKQFILYQDKDKNSLYDIAMAHDKPSEAIGFLNFVYEQENSQLKNEFFKKSHKIVLADISGYDNKKMQAAMYFLENATWYAPEEVAKWDIHESFTKTGRFLNSAEGIISSKKVGKKATIQFIEKYIDDESEKERLIQIVKNSGKKPTKPATESNSKEVN